MSKLVDWITENVFGIKPLPEHLRKMTPTDCEESDSWLRCKLRQAWKRWRQFWKDSGEV